MQELKAAKLTPAFAQTVGIAIDYRRANASEESLQLNVQRLENYKSKLILFPRRADKPKKGEINDSTADRLKSAEAGQQNVHKHVLDRPAPKVRQAAQKLTQELRDARVFKRLRQLRINKKYKGKREKRAKEAAEKEGEKKQ